MREIKFRAWLADLKEIVSVTDLHLEDKMIGFESKENKDVWNIKHFKLMQFTGLKDKKGIDIYEGDILENPKNKTSVVVWTLNGYFAESKKDDRITSFPVSLYFVENIEIIGNIYENPELLNK